MHYIHSNENLLSQKLYQTIAGDTEDDAGSNHLKAQPVFTKVIGTDAPVSQPSLARFSDDLVVHYSWSN